MTFVLPQRDAGIASAAAMAIGAMVVFQLGAALSRPMVAEIGAPAVVWLRFVAAAAVMLVMTRPRLLQLDRAALRAALMLGGSLAVMSVAYFAAVSRLPLGLASTIAFLGPLMVAVLGARGWRPLALALLAGLGVALSLDVWSLGSSRGWEVDATGLAFAAIAACGFGFYVLLSRRVGSLFQGSDGLTISLLTAAVLLTPFGLAGLDKVPSVQAVAGSAGIAILTPLLTCWLELLAIRRLGTQVFSVLLSLEPAIAAALGLALLLEVPNGVQLMGILCVVAASVGVVRLTAAEARA